MRLYSSAEPSAVPATTSPGSISLRRAGGHALVDQPQQSVGDHPGVEPEILVSGKGIEHRGSPASRRPSWTVSPSSTSSAMWAAIAGPHRRVRVAGLRAAAGRW